MEGGKVKVRRRPCVGEVTFVHSPLHCWVLCFCKYGKIWQDKKYLRWPRGEKKATFEDAKGSQRCAAEHGDVVVDLAALFAWVRAWIGMEGEHLLELWGLEDDPCKHLLCRGHEQAARPVPPSPIP